MARTRAQLNAYMRAYRTRLKARGLCPDCRSPIASSAHLDCLDRRARYQRERMRKRRGSVRRYKLDRWTLTARLDLI